MKPTRCPSCNREFDTEKARIKLGIAGSTNEILGMEPGKQGWEELAQECAMVECPHCRHRFVSDSIRYFGFLTREGLMKSVVIGTTLLVVFVVLMITLDHFDLLKYLP